MSKHTAGPWVVEDDASRYADSKGCYYIRDAVGHVGRTQARGEEKNLANARLMAAAPDLLEALKEVLAISDRKHDAWDKAHAAIAKAESAD